MRKHIYSAAGGFVLATVLATQTPWLSAIPTWQQKQKLITPPGTLHTPGSQATVVPGAPYIEGTIAHADGSYSPAAETEREALARLAQFRARWRKLTSVNLPSFKVKVLVDGLADTDPLCRYITLSEDSPETNLAAESCFQKYLAEIWSHPDVSVRNLKLSQVLGDNFDRFPKIVTSEFQKLLISLKDANTTIDRNSLYLAQHILAANEDVDYFAAFRDLKVQGEVMSFIEVLVAGFRIGNSNENPDLHVEDFTATWAMTDRISQHLSSTNLQRLYADIFSRFMWPLKSASKDFQNRCIELLPSRISNYTKSVIARDRMGDQLNISIGRMPASEFAKLGKQYDKLCASINKQWEIIILDGIN